jgi:U3 small nucleolar RNA-associated protein 6
MDAARGYFMRGCRFCTSGGEEVWIEYARSELEWLRKLEAKKKKGVAKTEQTKQLLVAEGMDDEGMMAFDDDSDEEDNVDEDGILLPDPDAADGKKQEKVFDSEEQEKLEQKNPALDGAIPQAIFDVAKKQAFFGAAAAEAFFDVFSKFPEVSSQPRIVQHALDAMVELYPTHPSTCSCLVRQPLIGVNPYTAEFPKALRISLARVKDSMEKTEDKPELAAKTVAWIEPLLGLEDLDNGIKTVLEHTKTKLQSQ